MRNRTFSGSGDDQETTDDRIMRAWDSSSSVSSSTCSKSVELLVGDDRRERVPLGQLPLEVVEHALKLCGVVGGHRRAVRRGRGAAEPKGGSGAPPDPLHH